MKKTLEVILDSDHRTVENYLKKGISPREITKKFNLDHKITGITGLRGIGKSTFLVGERIATPNSLYFSADRLELRNMHLFDLLAEISLSQGITTFFIDEIHYLVDRDVHLKNIFDLLDIRIIFSGSSSINISKSVVDLSRRVVIRHMPVFSYREYLSIAKQIILPRFTLDEILEDYTEISRKYATKHSSTLFQGYLQTGQFGYSFSDGGDYAQLVSRSMSKFVYEDLVQFVDLKSTSIRHIEDTLYYLGKMGTTEVSTNSLAKKLGVSAATVSKYLSLLDEGGVLDILIYHGNLTDRLRKERKYYFTNTNYLYLFEPDIGLVRETFVNMVLQHSDITPKRLLHRPKTFFQKNTDFIFETNQKTYFLEVGGKKKRRNDALVVMGDLLYGEEGVIPMWLLGLV